MRVVKKEYERQIEKQHEYNAMIVKENDLLEEKVKTEEA